MRRKKLFWLLAAALAALLWCGCAGIIAEKRDETGKTERVRVGTTDKWSTWERNPTKKDESVFLLKKESTF
jgi:hypothetical protein